MPPDTPHTRPAQKHRDTSLRKGTLRSSLEPTAQGPIAGRFGLLVFMLVVMLIGLLAGLYWWYEVISQPPATPAAPVAERPTAAENNEPESTTAEAQVETMRAVSPSDELSAIEADLESTQLNALDAELTAIEAELDAAIEASE